MQKEKPSVDSSGMRTPKSPVTSSSSTEPLKEHWDARLPEFWQFLETWREAGLCVTAPGEKSQIQPGPRDLGLIGKTSHFQLCCLTLNCGLDSQRSLIPRPNTFYLVYFLKSRAQHQLNCGAKSRLCFDNRSLFTRINAVLGGIKMDVL